MIFVANSAHPIITQWRAKQLQYIVIPKALLMHAERLGISTDDALLYCVLRSRCDLSYRNHWIDENGRVYIIFTRPQAMEYLGWSKNKTIAAFNSLSEAGLIQEVDRGGKFKQAKWIFVKQWNEPYDDQLYKLPDNLGISYTQIKNGQLPYLTADNIFVQTGSYFVLPRLLMEHESYSQIPLLAKLLYVIALDELQLSISYGDKIDENGYPYFYLDNESVLKQLRCSPRTLTTLYQHLTEAGLMDRKKVGFSKDWRIYLRDYVPTEDPSVQAPPKPDEPPAPTEKPQIPHDTPYTQKLNHIDAKSEPHTRKKTTPYWQDLNPSYPPVIHPRESDPLLSKPRPGSSPARGDAEKSDLFFEIQDAKRRMKDQIEYQELCQDFELLYKDKDQINRAVALADRVTELAAKDLVKNTPTVHIGRKTIDRSVLEFAYGNLDHYTTMVMIQKVLERRNEIRSVDDYLHQCMVDAADKHSGEAYYCRLACEERRRQAQRPIY